MPDLRSLLHVLVTEQRADLMRALQHLNSDFLPLCLFHRADDGVTPWDLAMASHASEVVMAAERYKEALQRPNETEAQMIKRVRRAYVMRYVRARRLGRLYAARCFDDDA